MLPVTLFTLLAIRRWYATLKTIAISNIDRILIYPTLYTTPQTTEKKRKEKKRKEKPPSHW